MLAAAMSDQVRDFIDWKGLYEPLLARMKNLFQRQLEEISGVIETIDRYVEPASAGIGRIFRSGFKAEGVALLLDTLFYGAVLAFLYAHEIMWLRGDEHALDGHPLSLLEMVSWQDFVGMSAVNIAIYMLLQRFALFRLISRLVHRGGRLLRELLFFTLFMRSSRTGDVPVYNLTLLNPHSGQTYGVRMRGWIEGAPFVVGHRITCRGTYRYGVLYVREGVDHEYPGGARFVCRAKRR
jgi:hypothetical protein